jgi:hypothetical protein
MFYHVFGRYVWSRLCGFYAGTQDDAVGVLPENAAQNGAGNGHGNGAVASCSSQVGLKAKSMFKAWRLCSFAVFRPLSILLVAYFAGMFRLDSNIQIKALLTAGGAVF